MHGRYTRQAKFSPGYTSFDHVQVSSSCICYKNDEMGAYLKLQYVREIMMVLVHKHYAHRCYGQLISVGGQTNRQRPLPICYITNIY